MMLLEESRVALPAHVTAGPDAFKLNSIRHSTITMAVWERSLDAVLADAVHKTLASGFDGMRLTLPPDEIALTFSEQLVASGGLPSLAKRIASDIALLGHQFANVMNCERLDIRLERIRGNACRKFHADYVMARLISTYSGRATEWLEKGDAARLARGDNLTDIPIRSLRAGDVALFKGKLWAKEDAIIHRSPPIAGTGEQRLLLVINPGTGPREDLC